MTAYYISDAYYFAPAAIRCKPANLMATALKGPWKPRKKDEKHTRRRISSIPGMKVFHTKKGWQGNLFNRDAFITEVCTPALDTHKFMSF